MDILTFYGNLSYSTRYLIATILINAPFWFMGMALFSNWFVKTNPLLVQLVVVFCITVCWLIAVSFIFSTKRSTPEIPGEGKEANTMSDEKETEEYLTLITIVSMILLGLSTFVFYLMQGSFKWFVITNFSLVVLIGQIRFFSQYGKDFIAEFNYAKEHGFERTRYFKKNRNNG